MASLSPPPIKALVSLAQDALAVFAELKLPKSVASPVDPIVI